MHDPFLCHATMPLTMFFTLCLTASAQDNAKKAPLAELPSKSGAHIEKIKAMGDNQWLNLGAPAADPKWGKARGSSWGAKALILAPDKRGAFLFGEGVHAYVKPDGHRPPRWDRYAVPSVPVGKPRLPLGKVGSPG